MGRFLQLPVTLALLFFSLSDVARGQTAVYQGRTYTPESFPRATWCNCSGGMCANIRSQWRAQGWISGYGPNKVMYQTVTQQVLRPRTVVPVSTTAPTAKVEYRTETRYRTVTKYRTTSVPVKQCYRDWRGQQRCKIVYKIQQTPYQVQEAYTVQVAVPKAKPEAAPIAVQVKPKPTPEPDSNDISDEPDGTPQAIVDAMLAVMGLNENDTLWDIGSGRDARFLITASKRYGCRGIGVEISHEHVAASRQLIQQAGLADKIAIIHADALGMSYGTARKVVMYQYGDLLDEVVAKLSPKTLVGSYAHPPSGFDSEEFRVGNDVFYVGLTDGDEPLQVATSPPVQLREANTVFGLDAPKPTAFGL